MTMMRMWAWVPVSIALVAAVGHGHCRRGAPGRGTQSQTVHVRTGQGSGVPSPVLPGSDQGRPGGRSPSTTRLAIKRVVRDANTLAVLALVLGKHDETNRFQASAATLLESSLGLAEKSQNHAEAKAAYGKLVEATTAAGGSADLTWKSVGDIVELMNQVPTLNTNLRGTVRSDDSVRQIARQSGRPGRDHSPPSPRCRCWMIPIVRIRPIGQIGSSCAD